MNQFEKCDPVEKFKLVQKKFEPEVNLNHNIYTPYIKRGNTRENYLTQQDNTTQQPLT